MKRNWKKWAALLAAAAVVLSAAAYIYAQRKARLEAQPEFVLTYAENQTEDYPTTKAAFYFAQLVAERTGGKVEIQIHPDSALGDELAVMDQMEFGGIDFTRVSLATIADIFPKLNILQMPYLYKDSDHMWKVLDGKLGSLFMEELDGSPFVPLSWYDAGARSFYTTGTPLTHLEDLKGLRIRVAESSLMTDVITALGAIPVPMAFDQVYQALETGQIDGAENNWPSYEAMRHYRPAPYFTEDEHLRIPEMQLISRKTWEKLPQEYQEIILGCAKESARYQRRLWSERVRTAKNDMEKAGVTTSLLAPGEREKFIAAMKPVYDKYSAGYEDLVKAIRALGEEESQTLP